MTTTIRRDLFFAYLAAAARVLSWVVVSAIVYRKLGAVELGILTLVRSTVGFLNYAGLGLAPALVHRMAKALKEPTHVLPIQSLEHNAGDVLSYATPASPKASKFPTHVAYSSGWLIAGLSAILAAIALGYYSTHFEQIHSFRIKFPLYGFVFNMGAGVLLRWLSDVPGSVLQSTGKIWLDNLILGAGELSWAVISLPDRNVYQLETVAYGYAISGSLILAARWITAGFAQQLLLPHWRWIRWSEITALLAFGLAVVAAQLAEFLYAPASSILIHHLLGPAYLADYAPALQIDAGLLLLVAAIASVLLPRAALAAADNRPDLLRRYYIQGTLVSFAVLLAAAVVIALASPLIFRAWLGDDMPETREILPWMLIHTVVGGASSPGRSILLGMGRVRAFTLSVLIAGVANVILAYLFVRYFGMGLKGIVLATIVVVVSRSIVWQPAYVLRAIAKK